MYEKNSIIKRAHVDELLSHLHNQHPSIRFTIKNKKDVRLPFVDLSILHWLESLITSPKSRKMNGGTWVGTYNTSMQVRTWYEQRNESWGRPPSQRLSGSKDHQSEKKLIKEKGHTKRNNHQNRMKQGKEQ